MGREFLLVLQPKIGRSRILQVLADAQSMKDADGFIGYFIIIQIGQI